MHCFRCLLGVHTQAPKRPNPTNAQKPSNSATLSSNRCAKSCNLSYQIHKFDPIDYETNVQERIVYLCVKIVHQNEELLPEPLTNRLPSCSANRWPKNKPKEYPQQPETKTVAKHAMSEVCLLPRPSYSRGRACKAQSQHKHLMKNRFSTSVCNTVANIPEELLSTSLFTSST